LIIPKQIFENVFNPRSSTSHSRNPFLKLKKYTKLFAKLLLGLQCGHFQTLLPLKICKCSLYPYPTTPAILDILFTSHEVPRQEVFLISQVLNFSSGQIFSLALYFKHKIIMNFAPKRRSSFVVGSLNKLQCAQGVKLTARIT